jgi:dTDP-4-amino-4,6-dideoxygalactose transaminase
LWNGIKPIFVDIDPVSLNLDPYKIEAAITPQTTAIMPVHCYGYPCDVEAIQRIADNYNLKVIYDAAHAFDVRDQNHTSLLNSGDLSILSFHATKVFNTFEGGAIVCPDERSKRHIDHLKNFGFADEVTVVAAGINGKMSEINAAFGLLQLKGMKSAIKKRQKIDENYRDGLKHITGIRCGAIGSHISNYSYFPIFVEKNYPLSRDALYEKLKVNGILGRRYFFPLISEFPMYRGMSSAIPSNLPIAHQTANTVICLPIYSELKPADQAHIIALIAEETMSSQIMS